MQELNVVARAHIGSQTRFELCLSNLGDVVAVIFVLGWHVEGGVKVYCQRSQNAGLDEGVCYEWRKIREDWGFRSLAFNERMDSYSWGSRWQEADETECCAVFNYGVFWKGKGHLGIQFHNLLDLVGISWWVVGESFTHQATGASKINYSPSHNFWQVPLCFCSRLQNWSYAPLIKQWSLFIYTLNH